ncbi:hypothetical protein SDC9_176017 [bioreactor metagenome]|uniref:Uncharacterized protein n=1 Tax=bioreactor metagenome TaxID=1076179 RepID=A0A645GPD6_9ZZZZ
MLTHGVEQHGDLRVAQVVAERGHGPRLGRSRRLNAVQHHQRRIVGRIGIHVGVEHQLRPHTEQAALDVGRIAVAARACALHQAVAFVVQSKLRSLQFAGGECLRIHGLHIRVLERHDVARQRLQVRVALRRKAVNHRRHRPGRRAMARGEAVLKVCVQIVRRPRHGRTGFRCQRRHVPAVQQAARKLLCAALLARKLVAR